MSDVDTKQSDEVLAVATDEDGGCCWQICIGGVCLVDRNIHDLIARAKALRESL